MAGPRAAQYAWVMENASCHIAAQIEEFPEWFSLRGQSGVFRIDKIRSRCDGVVVLAGLGGREVGRCSAAELRENIFEAS